MTDYYCYYFGCRKSNKIVFPPTVLNEVKDDVTALRCKIVCLIHNGGFKEALNVINTHTKSLPRYVPPGKGTAINVVLFLSSDSSGDVTHFVFSVVMQ